MIPSSGVKLHSPRPRYVLYPVKLLIQVYRSECIHKSLEQVSSSLEGALQYPPRVM